MKKIVITIVLTVFFPLNSMSQNVEFENGIPPTKPLQHVVVIVENPTFKTSPKRSGEELPDPPGYLESLTAYAQSKRKKYYLVQKSTGEWGWMKTKELLDSRYALRSEEKANPAFLKILPKNNWRIKKTLFKDTIFRKGPGPEFGECGKVSIFKIRYAFRMEETDNGDKYVFVGNHPEWDHAKPSKYLDGWIKKDYCILWDNQVAVYYDKENLKKQKRKPTLIFEDNKSLKNYNNSGIKEKVIWEEEKEYEELDADTTRFPILSQSKDMIHIAFIGDALDKKTNKIVKKRAIEKKIGNINRIISQIEKVDILFLVDATKTMRNYFKPVAQGITEFIEGLSNRERSRYRFAFAVYRDHKDSPKDYQLICDFGNPNIVTTIKQTANMTYSKNNEFPEAIYQGIHKGVSQLFPNFGMNLRRVRGSFTRAVVVIGDHGNHEPLKGKITPKIVTDLLIERATAFYAINLRVRDDVLRYNQLFQSQMKSILESIGTNGEMIIIESQGQDEILKIKERIISTLKAHFEFSDQTAKAAKDYVFENKPLDYIRRTYGIRITSHMFNTLKKFGWTDKNFRTSNFSQLCLNGWISKKDRKGVDQLEPYCLIPRYRLHDLCSLMSGIKFKILISSKDIDGLIRGACQNSVRDPILDNETIAEYLQRVVHIPFREVSAVLRKTPREIKEEFKKGNDSFKKEFKKQIDKKYCQLDLILQNETADLKWDASNEVWLKNNIREKEWFYTAADGLKYCWLPFEYLP